MCVCVYFIAKLLAQKKVRIKEMYSSTVCVLPFLKEALLHACETKTAVKSWRDVVRKGIGFCGLMPNETGLISADVCFKSDYRVWNPSL